jgi:hypothetical protein
VGSGVCSLNDALLPNQAAAGRMLYNTADMERGGGAGDGDTAAILEGTQLCCTRQLRDLLPCLGGVAALLPLVGRREPCL